MQKNLLCYVWDTLSTHVVDNNIKLLEEGFFGLELNNDPGDNEYLKPFWQHFFEIVIEEV